jgi:hypothetical protein
MADMIRAAVQRGLKLLILYIQLYEQLKQLDSQGEEDQPL